MHRLKLIQVALLALPLVALGCGRQRADTRETYREASPLPGTGTAAAVELGSRVGNDGRLEGHSDNFKRGEPIIASLDGTTLKAGTAVRLSWMGPQGQDIASDEIVVPPDARLITFKAQDTTGWAPGTYRVDFNVAGAPSASKTFTIE
jgi:hypothetical protein